MGGNISGTDDTSIAILHDRFSSMGGGETFAIEAARTLDASIYTMYISSTVSIPDDVNVIPIRQDKYARGLSKHVLEWKNEGMNPLETLSVALDMTDAHPDLQNYDVLLESAPLSKQYVPTVDQKVVHYPHSPPRWLYDLYRDRLNSFDYPGVRTFLKAFTKWWRAFDKEANDYVDTFVANSELIRDRIHRYYDQDAVVVYPPVTGDWRNEGDEGYFVTWSRLAPEKRIDLIVDAFTDLDERLIVAGDGEERARLERLAAGHDNIEIRGFVDDIESLVAKATAVVYAPKQEDFGLVGAETLMAGKPLIGVNDGFTSCQVTEQTGVLFDPTTDSLRRVVERFDPDDYDADEIRQVGQQYSHENFEQSLTAVIESLEEQPKRVVQ